MHDKIFRVAEGSHARMLQTELCKITPSHIHISFFNICACLTLVHWSLLQPLQWNGLFWTTVYRMCGAVGSIAASQGSRVPSLILCGVSCVLIFWVSSRFSSTLTPPKYMQVGELAILHRYECVCLVYCDRMVSHPKCFPASCSRFQG